MNDSSLSAVPQDQRNLAMLAHILGIIACFLGPMIIWLISKDKPDQGFVTEQSKEALNFQLTLLIAYVVGVILTIIIIGVFISLAAWLACLVFSIIAAVKVSNGENYRYPFALRLIK